MDIPALPVFDDDEMNEDSAGGVANFSVSSGRFVVFCLSVLVARRVKGKFLDPESGRVKRLWSSTANVRTVAQAYWAFNFCLLVDILTMADVSLRVFSSIFGQFLPPIIEGTQQMWTMAGLFILS